jgi:hypothetical protein
MNKRSFRRKKSMQPKRTTRVERPDFVQQTAIETALITGYPHPTGVVAALLKRQAAANVANSRHE